MNLEQRIANLEMRVKALENPLDVASTTPKGKSLSPKEFLLKYGGDGDVDITFLLCCYVERFEAMESFTVGDIEKLFRSARVPVPANLNDKINKNIAKGLITEAKDKKDGKKAWVVTLSGEQSFESRSLSN